MISVSFSFLCVMSPRLSDDAPVPESHAMSRLVPEAVSHLTESDLTYFSHWTLCLDLEEEHARRTHLKHIWTTSSAHR